MGYASTKQAIDWLASDMGRKADRDRAEILIRLNDVRRLFYSIYQKIRLNFYSEACFPVKMLYEKGQNGPQTYPGITLPQEMEQIEAIWSGVTPLPIYNNWYEYKGSIKSGLSQIPRSIDMGGDHPLPIDWNPELAVHPKFIATDVADCGKIVSVSFVDSNNENVREDLKLSTDGVATTGWAKSIRRPGGIVLPTDLVGGVMVQDAATSAFLGHLAPSNTIPAFRRLKLTGTCEGECVQVRATRKYADVFYDWEVVETDNKLAIVEAYRYLKIMEVNSSDAQWLAKARVHIENATQYLAGDNYRSDGASTVRKLNLNARVRNRRRLLGKARL
jgi:hypothetical protein